MLLSAHVTSVQFLVWFNNFTLTTGFYWSCMLLLKSPILMCSWSPLEAVLWTPHLKSAQSVSPSLPTLPYTIYFRLSMCV